MDKRLLSVLFFVWMLAGCGERSREVKSLPPAPDTLQADVRKDTPVTLPKVSTVVPTVADDTPDYCHQLIHSLIDKSSFEPEMKKLGYGVWVDTVYHGIAIIHLLLLEEHGHLGHTVGWVKIDFNQRKLWDISLEDSAIQLNYDTTLLNRLDEKCLQPEYR